MYGIAQFLDVQFVDSTVAASANVSPASITNGVTVRMPVRTESAQVACTLAVKPPAISDTRSVVS